MTLSAESSRTCPIHPGGATELPLSEFGICRARKDGLNLYCKACNTQKSYDCREVRRQLRARGVLTGKRSVKPGRKPNVLSKPVEKPLIAGLSMMANYVLSALDSGARTQREIRAHVREKVDDRLKQGRDLLNDEIGNALGELFGERLIRTTGTEWTRQYFRRQVAA